VIEREDEVDLRPSLRSILKVFNASEWREKVSKCRDKKGRLLERIWTLPFRRRHLVGKWHEG